MSAADLGRLCDSASGCPCLRPSILRPLLQLRSLLPSGCRPPWPPPQEAEVIFAPYSYLIDPVIRRAMTVGEGLSLRGWPGTA
jgi:hypothetical protein